MINPYAEDLNYVIAAGMRSPGRARFSGLSVPYKWDVQAGYGREGGHVVYRGRELAQFTLSIDVWRPEHFVVLEAWVRLLDPPRPRAMPMAVGVQHPRLAAAGVEKVVLKKRGDLVQGTNGVWTVDLELLEYRPPLPRLAKPRGSVPSAADDSASTTVQSEAERALVAERDAFNAAKENAAK